MQIEIKYDVTNQTFQSLFHLNRYFDHHVCSSVCHVAPVTFKFSIPAVVPQHESYKSCLVCVNSEKYRFLATLRPLGSMRGDKAEPI